MVERNFFFLERLTLRRNVCEILVLSRDYDHPFSREKVRVEGAQSLVR